MHNFLENLDLPTTFVNDMLQGELKRGGKTVARFRSTPPSGWAAFSIRRSQIDIPDHGEDFGQTLAVWGVGDGPYLMLPFLGPSSPRDADRACRRYRPGSHHLDPFQAAHLVGGGARIFHGAGPAAPNLSTDPGNPAQFGGLLCHARSLYRQFRDNEIRNGRVTKENLPDL